MRRLACAALLVIGCTTSDPADQPNDGSSSQTGGSETHSGSADAGPADEGSTQGPATTEASGSSGGEPVCPEACGEHATCVDAGSGPECACDPGYAGDGSDCVPVPMLPSLAWQVDCMGDSRSCGAADDCVIDMPMDAHEVVRSESALLTGDPDAFYEVTLRLRAVVEPKDYDGGDTNDHWNEGGTPVLDGRNVAYIEVDSPPRLIYVNAGSPTDRHCLAIDQGLTVRMRGGSRLSIGMIDPDNCAIVNIDERSGTPISLPDVEAPAQPHDGQFMLVDVVSIEAE